MKKSISLSYEEYITLLNAISIHIEKETEREDEEIDETVVNELAMLKVKLVKKLNS